MATYIKLKRINRHTASGAIRMRDGVVALSGASALAMTITSPTNNDDGSVLTIMATTAQAHTVTYGTVGFNGGSTAKDVATFGGAIGDNLVLTAISGVWYVVSSVNVTIA